MSHSVVIGGAGFVGSWVVDEILKDPEAKVTIIDNLISSEKTNISNNPRITFVEGSAAEFITFEQITGGVDFVYQLACFHGNQSSISQPLNDLENGLKTTLVTLEWVKLNHPMATIVYASAGCAFATKTWDVPEAVKEIEKTNLLHDSPYSITKLTGEMYCLLYSRLYDLNIIRLRFQNVYGPREILGAGIWRGNESTVWRNVVPTFIWKALNNEEIQVFGSGSRDFIYVEDLATTVVHVAKSGIRNEVLNLASGIETYITDLARTIIRISNSKSKISLLAPRNWDYSGRRLGDTSKLYDLFEISSKTSLETGLIKTIEWTQQNLILIRNSMNKHVSNMS